MIGCNCKEDLILLDKKTRFVRDFYTREEDFYEVYYFKCPTCGIEFQEVM